MRPFIFLPSAFILSIILSACLPGSTSVFPPASPGDILYQEQFENNTTGWARVSNENGIMDYDGGGYRILIQQPGFNLWSTPKRNFGDVRIEADVTKLNGPDENRAGLMCRYQNGDYYFFIISSDGFYAIGKFIGGNTLLLDQTEMRSTEFIKVNEPNHLRADCIGNTLSFYVNFNEVAVVQDSDFPSGDVGVLAGAFSQPGVDVLFDDFVVIQP